MQKYAEERNRDDGFLTERLQPPLNSIADEQQSKDDAFWLVKRKPKPGYDPSTRGGKVLAGMTVKFWIDKATCQWQRMEAQVEKPC